MSAAYQIFQLPKATQIDSSVRVVPGAKANFYVTGTTTFQNTYTDAALTIPSSNPVVADANGVFAPIYLDPTLVYKLTLTTSAAVLIYTVDPVNDQILSQTVIGALLYPITPFEVSASVTPVNFFWPPGVLDRYLTNATPGTTDMTAAWNAANLQSAQGGAPIIPRRVSGGYAFGSAIAVDYRSDVDAENGAYITYTGSSEIAFLVVGEAAQTAQFRKLNLPEVRRNSQSNWTNEANIGVKFFNVSDSSIWLPRVNGFTLNVQTLPTGGNGFQFNKIYLGSIYNGKVQLDLSSATAGYTNQIEWYGGRMAILGNANPTLARYGVRITSSDGVYVSNNANTFYGPAFELAADTASGEAVCILMTNGINNKFLACRDENNDTPFAREANASTENIYDVLYSSYVGPPTIESTSSSPNYLVTNSRSQVLTRPTRVVYQSGPMHKRACYYDGGTNVHIPYVAQANINNATVFSNGSNVTFNANYLSFATGGLYFPSITIDTSRVKQFVVSKDVEASFGGRVAIQCYDAQGGGGSIITTASSVKGTVYNPFGTSVSANFGNVFQIGSDSNDDVYFEVAAAVKSIRVIIFGADANLRIRSFEILSLNTVYQATAQTNYDEIVPGANIGTTPPTAGTWARGMTLFNATPSAATTPGWVCTTAGTPGTWKARAAVAA